MTNPPRFDKSHPDMTNPTHIWQTPPYMTNPTQIWQTSDNIFCKGYPLWFLKSRNRALWLVKKASHDQIQGLSLVENISCNFLYPLRRIGVCHKWVGFVNIGTLPIYDKPWWQIPGFVTWEITGPEGIGAHFWQIPSDKSHPIWLVNRGMLKSPYLTNTKAPIFDKY